PSDAGGAGPPRRGRRGNRRPSRTAGTSPLVLTRPLPGCLIRHMGNNATVTRGLRVRRGRATVIDGLDLEVPQGAIVGLLGPSGSGKTTLMRAIVGVQIIAGGSVRVLGESAGSTPLRRRVGYMTQAASIYDDLS